ncbi:MAG: GNAT family N-acetyltransferase [Planctomycetaceae bacterium]
MTPLAPTTRQRTGTGSFQHPQRAPHFRPAPAAAYDAEIFETSSEIDAELWNSLCDRADVFMTPRFFGVVERTMSDCAACRYVLLYDAQGAPAACACISTFTLDSLLLAPPGPTRRILSAISRVFPVVNRHKVVFCGLPFSSGDSHLRFAAGADHAAILQALDRTLQATARREGARCIVLKEFREDELAALGELEILGYRRADSLPMNELELAVGDFETFLAGLNHKKRCDIRRSLKKLGKGHLRVLVTSDAAEVEHYLTEDVYQLYRAVFDRAQTKLELLPRQFFVEAIRQLPEHFECSFVLEGERVLGFGLSAFAGDRFHPIYMGLDYSRNHEHDLYFNILYQAVASAQRHGARSLTLGQDADELKRSKLGAFQTARYIYVKGNGPIIDGLIRLLFDRLFPHRPVQGAAGL